MNGDSGTSTPHTTQLRALLFTDLCDSTLLVERMGDAAAAELFQDHDRLVMALQQRWNGQQIDRSDGLFMLFERPVDALGFGLDYQRGLQALGGKRNILLRARIGLHVGEVLLWNNSAESIALGAKPVEVEGLAKPMAARLMQLAQPGQFLVSATAESMVRRAAGDLGEISQGLKWKSFGRWRFKGVAQSMEVFGLHDPATRGLGRPRQSAKASRDIPFWRQPAMMTAEVTLAAALVVGGWLLTRPQPAIAFAERDWVVVGKLKNFTGNAMLDDSMEQALRISLEQSPYLNVLTDDQVSRALTMMRRQGGEALDREQASAIAMRSGARLVLMPTVANVGGRPRFSVEVVEPQSQRTLVSASATAGGGEGALLAAVDDVSRQLRQRLGEDRTVIGNASQPLPEVTTPNMDALRAYALGQKRYSRGDFKGASAFFQQATEIDPDFALAWLGQSRCRFVSMDYQGASQLLEEARKRSEHLTPRERLYVRNWALQIGDPDRATDGWARMAELYPDYVPASYNAALNLFHENRMEEALVVSRRVSKSKVELPEVAQDQYGRALLASEQYRDADIAFSRAAINGWGGALMRQATVAAAQRQFDKANELLGRIAPDNFHAGNFATTIALDEGNLPRAISLAEQGRALAQHREGMDRYNFDVPLAVAYMMAGDKERALKLARAASTAPFHGLDKEPTVEQVDRLVSAHAAALMSLRLGDAAPARAVQKRVDAIASLPSSIVLQQFRTLLAARLLEHEGQPQQAMDMLKPLLQRQPRLQVRLAVHDLALELGQQDVAQAQARWLRERPGFAYAEAQCSFCLQALNVADVRRLSMQAASGQAPLAALDGQRSVRGSP